MNEQTNQRSIRSLRGPARRRVVGGVGLVLALSWLSGCASQTPPDKLRSALQVEYAAHHRTAARMYQLDRELQEVRAALHNREQRLQHAEKQIAQAQLDSNRARKKREEASHLVDQLRGELARVGDHMQAFAKERKQRRHALERAESRVAQLEQLEQGAARRVDLTRDLAVLLHERIATGRIELQLRDGGVQLDVPSERVLAGGSQGMHREAAGLLAAIARVAKLYPKATLQLSEQAGPSREPEQAEMRLRQVADALHARGVPSAQTAVQTPQPPSESTDEPSDAATQEETDEADSQRAKAADSQATSDSQPADSQAAADEQLVVAFSFAQD